MSVEADPGATESPSVEGPPSGAPVSRAPTSREIHAHEIAVAVRNALKLGGSLILTWTVALIVKLQIPAHLGPIRNGRFGFSDGFAAMFFSAVSLGIETYIYKEVPVRPKHASDFMGGVFAVRGVLSLVVFIIMAATLYFTGRPTEVILTACVFGVSQVLMSANGTLAAVLQAVTHVGRLAVANVAAKVIWGAGLLIGLYYDVPLWALALPMAISELLKTFVLVPSARIAANLRYQINVAATKAAIIASFPYFVNMVAVGFGNSLAISSLEYIRLDEREVGWFAACQNIASLAMLLHPLLVWVVMPMLSRAQARSQQEASVVLRRALEGLVVVIGPATVFISSGADIFVRLAFGVKFAPATLGLSILSLVFIMTYTNIMMASSLIVSGRSWSVTSISILSIFVLSGLMLVLVPMGRHLFGVGGECAGASIAVITSEAATVVAMVTRFDDWPLDRRNISVTLKTILVSAIVLVLNHYIHDLGAIRLVIDMVAYLALALAIGVFTVKDIRQVVQIIKQRRQEKKSGAPKS
jgi:O-antigen/teichoic acid export membrane protein